MLHSQPVLDLLTFLLEHTFFANAICTLSQTDPPIPRPRLRVPNQLRDIRAEQLHFTLNETLIEHFAFPSPGINKVEHIYLYSVRAADADTRQDYLQQAYCLGKEFA